MARIPSEKGSAVVLLSGGQDSTTCLYWARANFADGVHAISFDYGQRHRAELEAAQAIAEEAGVPWFLAKLPVLAQLADSALTNPENVLTASGGLEDAKAPGGLPSSFVPGRNMLFLATAAAYAVKLRARHLVTGICQMDYSGYPDCREPFALAMEAAINAGMPSSCGIELHTPLMNLSKRDTVHLAVSLTGCMEALARSVTCYNGLRPGCGTCPACEVRRAGFLAAGVIDPATL